MALACAMEASSWADAVKNACHIGGDSDTIACMAGAIAEARFGLPREHALAAWEHLTPEMCAVVERFYALSGRTLPTSGTNLVTEVPRASAAAPAESSPICESLCRRFVAWLARL